jgi:hypothetical protein
LEIHLGKHFPNISYFHCSEKSYHPLQSHCIIIISDNSAQAIINSKRVTLHFVTLAMSSKKTIAVVGATGKQGGSVVDTFLGLANWQVRAITRNPASEITQALSARGK